MKDCLILFTGEKNISMYKDRCIIPNGCFAVIIELRFVFRSK